LARAVRGMGRIVRRVVPENIELDELGLRDGVCAWLDESQLEQVLLNLILNACDAMPRGGTLKIRTLSSDTEAILEVEDDGHGMDADTRSKLFEPFFSTKGEKGTGLGLASVHGIVEQSGGSIQVQSAPDRGSLFRVSFPRLSAQTGRAEVAANGAQIASTDRILGLRILVVEDSPLVCELVSSQLRSAGALVQAATTVREALEYAEASQALDLVISDVVMPSMNGPDFVRRVRRQHPGVAVLFMSGYTARALNDLDLEDARLLRKPFTLPQLMAEIDATVRRSQVAVSPAP
jgi:CheY-like chemotaxis protein